LAARNAWIEEGSDETDKQRRLASSFLAYKDDRGYVVDFHSLRKTFITNLSRAGVSPKAAQTLARHSDINLTMNTYTMLGVLDQAAAVESLPPVPQAEATTNRAGAITRATGTDGQGANKRPKRGDKKVPTVVPRGAEIGAVRLASETYQIAPSCTETGGESLGADSPISAKSPEKSGTTRTASHHASSTCSQRRARDSNPQPLARHLISNQTPSHSGTLRGLFCGDSPLNQAHRRDVFSPRPHGCGRSQRSQRLRQTTFLDSFAYFATDLPMAQVAGSSSKK